MAIQIDKCSDRWRLRQIDRDTIWAAIATEQDVFALRPTDGKAYSLQELTCIQVNALRTDENFVFFTVWDVPKEGAADERPED